MPDWGACCRGLCCLLVAGAAGAAQLERTQPIPESYFGLHVHRAHSAAYWPTVRFGSWRLWDAGVTWAQLEKARGQWNFHRLDMLLELAQGAGVQPLLPLAMTPQWASARPQRQSFYGPGQASEPSNVADWERYVRTVATRYRGRIRYYEIWNEPGSSRFFNGAPEALLDLQRRAYRILKSVDPGNVVIAPAPTKVKDLDWFDRYLALGGGDAADAVAYHLYTYDREPERIVELIRAVRARMRAHGVGGKPLWNTETGFDTADRTDPNVPRDAYMVRTLVMAWAAGVDRFYYYSWDHAKLGLMDAQQMRANTAGIGFDFAARHLVGARELRCPDRGRLRVCVLSLRDGTPARLVWTTSGGRQMWTAPAQFAGGRALAPREEKPLAPGGELMVDATPRLVVPSTHGGG